MIIINSTQSSIFLTITEEDYTNYNFIQLEVDDKWRGNKYYCILTDNISSDVRRYDEFTLTFTPSPDYTIAQLPLLDNGIYYANIYGTTESSATSSLTYSTLLESQRLIIKYNN